MQYDTCMKDDIVLQNRVVKQLSTIFLRIALIALGLMALGLAALILPAIVTSWEKEFSTVGYLKYPIVIILSAALIPYFTALYQAMKLLTYIDKNKAFSMLSVEALRKITYSGFVFSALFIAFLPIVYMVAQADDAPGLVIIGMIMAGAPMVVAVFAAVLQKLLQSAIAIKTENDLTV
jgi:hypothetical protein